jgi:hypothetical protein
VRLEDFGFWKAEVDHVTVDVHICFLFKCQLTCYMSPQLTGKQQVNTSFTALGIAARDGHTDVVTMLVKAGANVKAWAGSNSTNRVTA